MQREWDQLGHYQTADGDRVSLLKLDGQWAICWAYAYPREGIQLVGFGEAGPAAIDAFITARENRKLMFDSRVAWQSGSI